MVNTGEIDFKWGGKRDGAGRHETRKTQLKRFEEKHPEAYDQLMEVLFSSGLDGHSLDAQYVIDRIRGKPKSNIGIAEEDKGMISAALVLEFRKLVDTNLLEEGTDVKRGSEEEISEGVYEVEEV